MRRFSRDIPKWYIELCDKYPNRMKVKEGNETEAMKNNKEENLRKKKKKDNPMLSKAMVSHVLHAMHVDTKEAQENFRKLLCYFLICFYVDAPTKDIGALHHFADVTDSEKFEKICWAQVMLSNIFDSAKKVSSGKQTYITCNSPVVEVRLRFI